MRAAAAVCGVVLALAVAPLALGHGTGADDRGLGPWSDVGRAAAPIRSPGQELTQLRTRRSRTFARADGSRVTRVFQQSMHYPDGSRWRTIDNRLQRAGTAWENAANRYARSSTLTAATSPSLDTSRRLRSTATST